jgi:hypothetical protein
MERIKKLDEVMTVSNTEFWTLSMLRAINTVAMDKFKPCLQQIGMFEDVYLNKLLQYVREVNTVI